MIRRDNIPVCWVRFSAYMHPWIIFHFGRKEQYDGVPIVDICAVRGVEELLSKPYVVNSSAVVTSEWTFSDQLMRMMRAVLKLVPSVINQEFKVNEDAIRESLPVAVPEVVTAAGLNRAWNPTMQIASPVAHHIRDAVRKLYWQQLLRFDEHYKKTLALEGTPYTGEEMIDAWCTKYGIDGCYAESMGRMYRRAKSKLSNKR